MTTDPAIPTPAPWPRFTRPPEGAATRPANPPRVPASHEPWPRWGWFPREHRTWTFAPGPALVVEPPPLPPRAPAAPTPTPRADDAEARSAEPEVARAADAPGAEPDAPLDYLPVARPVSMALVPAGLGDVTLAEVAHAVRRAAPIATVVGVAAVAAMAFFRRR